MKKTFFLLVMCIGFSTLSFAQDTLVLLNGDSIVSKVSEISNSKIKYKDFYNIHGPDLIIRASKVQRIIFENGEEKIFSVGWESTFANESLGRNIVSYHMFDVIYNDFTFSYERISKNKRIGYRIPLSIGFNDEYSNSRDYFNIGYTGFGLNIYPAPHKKWTYFIGPEIQLGIGKEEVYHYGYPDGSSYSEWSRFLVGKLFLANGVHFSPVPELCLNSMLSLGVRYFDNSDYYDSGFRKAAYFTLMVGYRF